MRTQLAYMLHSPYASPLQPVPHSRLEVARFLGMQPMPRAGDLGELRPWEKRLDPAAVFGPDIVRLCPARNITFPS